MISIDTTKVVKSKFVQSISNNNLAIIWHSLFGHPHVISLNLLDIINQLVVPVSLNDLISKYSSDKDIQSFIDLMRSKYFLITEDCDERDILQQALASREGGVFAGSMVNNFSLVISEACNFCCTYCIHFSNLGTSNRLQAPVKVMSTLVAEKATDAFVQILRANGTNTAEINFGGGEPLLGWPTIVHVLEYCRQKYPDVKFNFSLNTNASLLSSEIVQVLKEHQVRIASSLDGYQSANDKVRLSSTGQGTFTEITNGFKVLAREDYPIDGFTITMTEANFPFIGTDIIDWAANQGMVEIRLDVDVVHSVNIDIPSLAEKIFALKSYADSRGIFIHGFWSRPRENMDSSPLEVSVGFCGGIKGHSIVVNPSQEVYCCGYSTTKLGSLDDLFTSEFFSKDQSYAQLIQSRTPGSMIECQGCMIEGQCSGGCQITQEFAKHSGANTTRMCEFYRRMTTMLLAEDLSFEEVT
ncbi:radical SAM protein [Patescibacteria group bacterium]|nr:radical SAM protein [Patescibacteria group bacterium]